MPKLTRDKIFLATVCLITSITLPIFSTSARAQDRQPLPNEVKITEIMVESGEDPQWLELRNATNLTLDLSGCRLRRPTAAAVHTFRNTTIEPNQYIFLTKTHPLPEGCPIADGTYTNLILPVSSEDTIFLECPSGDDEWNNPAIDTAIYNWGPYRASKGTSLIRDIETNIWCLGAHEPEFCSGFFGSPGAANARCDDSPDPDPDFVRPNPGEVVFSELMIEPLEGPSWIELTNLTGQEFNLSGCRLYRPSTEHQFIIGDLPIPAGQAIFMSRTHPMPEVCTPSDAIYGTINLLVTAEDSVQLQCPGNEEDPWMGEPIDEVIYDWRPYRAYKGTSLTLDMDSFRWCLAEEEDVFCLEEQGSPGKLNTNCPLDPAPNPAFPTPAPGEVLFTELMVEPDIGPQWIELANMSTKDLTLSGCRLRRPSIDSHYTIRNLQIPSGAYITLAASQLIPPDCGPTSATYGTINLLVTREDTLNLECPDEVTGEWSVHPVDQVIYDWSGHRQHKGTSLTRDPELGEWCLAEGEQDACEGMRASPGIPNAVCIQAPSPEPPLPRPEKGEVLITELMIEPTDGPQWIELQNMTDSALALDGCRLRRPSVQGSHTLRQLTLDAAESLVISRTHALLEECGPTDGTYGTISLLVTQADVLVLECPNAGGDDWPEEPIDTVHYDWSDKRSFAGQSYSRDPINGETWCITSEDNLMCEGMAGTPRQPNPACPDPLAYPEPGEVIITEMMIEPLVGPQWIEIQNLSTEPLTLSGCVLIRPAITTGKHTLRHLDINPGQVMLLVSGSAGFGEECNAQSDYSYSSIKLVMTKQDVLALECPPIPGSEELVTVDQVEYNWSCFRSQKGYSLQLSPEHHDGNSNSTLHSWCLAADLSDFCDGTDGAKDRGTPGEPNICGESAASCAGSDEGVDPPTVPGEPGDETAPPTGPRISQNEGCSCGLPGRPNPHTYPPLSFLFLVGGCLSVVVQKKIRHRR